MQHRTGVVGNIAMREQRHLTTGLAGACHARGGHAGVGSDLNVGTRDHAHGTRAAPQRTVRNQHAIKLDGAGGGDVDDAITVL